MDRSNGTTSQRFAVTRTVEPSLKLGEIVNTGNKLDVALTDEKSFFAVQTPEGVRYTRAGSVQVATDGTLVTPEGLPYLGENRRPIVLSPDARSATFSADGRVMVQTDPLGGIETPAKLMIVSFQNPGALQKEGDTLLRASAATGPAIASDAPLAVESLELSNSNPMKSMSGMISSARQFDMVTRVIEAFSNIEKRTATDLMRKG